MGHMTVRYSLLYYGLLVIAKTTAKAKLATTVPVCWEYYHEETKYSNTKYKILGEEYSLVIAILYS